MRERPTATEATFLPNARRVRAQRLLMFIMSTIGTYIPYENRAKVQDALLEEFIKAGADLVTDYDREQCGLEARGPQGWTPMELLAMDRARIARILEPVRHILPKGEAEFFGLTTQVDEAHKSTEAKGLTPKGDDHGKA